jgi:hypothetical protein
MKMVPQIQRVKYKKDVNMTVGSLSYLMDIVFPISYIIQQ